MRRWGATDWVFFGSGQGGKNGALLPNFTGSCQRGGGDPFRWLQGSCSRIGSGPISRLADVSLHTWAADQARGLG